MVAADDTGAPALSVTVLNYNYARYLPQCLDSILAQTWTDFELIVVDDGSTDGSPTVIERYTGDPRVRAMLHATNEGYVTSLIDATERLSRGEFLMVVSADDYALDPRAFEKQMGQMHADAGVVLCFSAYRKVGAGRDETRRVGSLSSTMNSTPNSTLNSTMESTAFLGRLLTDGEAGVLHSGALMRASAYYAAGGYQADLYHQMDFAMWVAIGATGRVSYIDEPLYAYRIHAGQLSGGAKNRRAMLREKIRTTKWAAGMARAAGCPVSDGRALRARIPDLALAEAFADRRLSALARAGDALLALPWICVSSRGWWIAVCRALGGRGAWRAAANLRAKLRVRGVESG